MKTSLLKSVIVFAILLAVPIAAAAEERARLAELDAFWSEVSRAVREGDFEGYKATCHGEGVLVTGIKQTSQPLSKALERWNQDFVNTKAGKVKASVEFRFSQRLAMKPPRTKPASSSTPPSVPTARPGRNTFTSKRSW